MVYRTVAGEEDGSGPRDQGIVGDVIAQFADPLAFYRELVQNAIDAGSPSVEIRIGYDESSGSIRIAVRDRGEGMTREIIEEQLLVLFRSTKERDPTKIGKFGIGFASVLAPDPAVVVVTTSRGGRRLVVHLQRDLSYELFDAGAVTQSGTVVELELPRPREALAELVAGSRRALVRWCRHASVPIELFVEQEPPERIDRPLDLPEALVSLRATSGDGHMTAIVGITAKGTSYAGFFNHGLMLHETSEPLLGRIAWKLQDARLGHTLSRDNVRRDEAFERAVAFARDLVAERLPGAVAQALAAAADGGDQLAHRALVDAIAVSGIELPRRAWRFPLLEPLAGATSISGADLRGRIWVAHRTSALTAALAEQGHAVLPSWLAYRQDLAQVIGDVAVTDEVLTCITPVERDEIDEALIAIVTALLGATYRTPTAVVLARLDGAHRDAFTIAGAAGREGVHTVEREHAAGTPFGLVRKSPLVINADHAWYRAARTGDPRLAASHLARAILIGYRVLEVARSTTILESTLEDLLGATR